ncbi:hypothetical protein BGX27_009183 [Mortierella sp. AM989]|nr:hypothetical protein BGX27_009183 [Mortierella sp. AM989]
MVMLKSTLSALAVIFVTAQPSNANPIASGKRAQIYAGSSVPVASDINGTHLLLLNDVDSNTTKNAFILLSSPKSYNDSMNACNSIGDDPYSYASGGPGASDLMKLLNNSAVAQAEVSFFTQFWVKASSNGTATNSTATNGTDSSCTALNKSTGNLENISCSTVLPIICKNSARRRRLLLQDTSHRIQVSTPVGDIQGWRDQNSFRFLGIPYGEAPIGDLRFAAPVAKAPFNGTWDAINYKSVCPQSASSTTFKSISQDFIENEGAPQQEDCLHLNVYTPSLKGTGEAGLPVMVYIHGGSFTSGSGGRVTLEPGNMVSRGGIVAVTLNYRLGMLGFMENESSWSRSSVPGNQGIHDQILALQWVQKNIASFGGDPKRVTIFGQSAGASSIRALLSAPSAFGLYQNAILQSDPINIPFKSPGSAANITSYFLHALNCSTTDLKCARSRSVEQIMVAQLKANAKAFLDDRWATPALIDRPSTDGDLIPADFSQLIKNGSYNTNASIMWGTVHDEAGSFVDEIFSDPAPDTNVTQVLNVLFEPNRTAQLLNSTYFKLNTSDPDGVRNLITLAGTDYYFFCPLRYLSREMAKVKTTYNFRFRRGRDEPFSNQTYCSTDAGRVCHSADIQPVFASGAVIPGYNQTGDDARFSRQVLDRFTTFAKTGNPNPQPGLIGVELTNPDVTGVQWAAYNETNPIMELDVNSSMSINSDNDPCTWLDNTFQYEFVLQLPNNSTNSTGPTNSSSTHSW